VPGRFGAVFSDSEVDFVIVFGMWTFLFEPPYRSIRSRDEQAFIARPYFVAYVLYTAKELLYLMVDLS
jgi:hypothetical protein